MAAMAKVGSARSNENIRETKMSTKPPSIVSTKAASSARQRRRLRVGPRAWCAQRHQSRSKMMKEPTMARKNIRDSLGGGKAFVRPICKGWWSGANGLGPYTVGHGFLERAWVVYWAARLLDGVGLCA